MKSKSSLESEEDFFFSLILSLMLPLIENSPQLKTYLHIQKRTGKLCTLYLKFNTS